MLSRASMKSGFEKVADFSSIETGEPTHCARQNIRGIWLSKLGGWYDIRTHFC
jgi:hypothetical protein